MQYVVVGLAAFAGGAFTLYSGFGLTVILLPLFAQYLHPQVAYGAVAVVHLADNIVKGVLVGHKANKLVVLLFGLPAAIGGLVAYMLGPYTSAIPPLARYQLGESYYLITLPGVFVGLTLLAAAVVTLLPYSYRVTLNMRYLPMAGALAGILGGAVEQYGAPRAACLINAGLPKEAFIATSALSAIALDVARLSVFGFSYVMLGIESLTTDGFALVAVAILCAGAGSCVGARYVRTVPYRWAHRATASLLFFVAIALVTGLL